MSSPTDTNQASELDKAIMTGFLYGIQSDLLPKEEVVHRMVAFSHTKGYKEALALIRTEKLKLLAEVRERVIGESFKPSGFDERYSRQEGDNGHITHYETKKDADTINQHQEYQRTELTKLEAEL